MDTPKKDNPDDFGGGNAQEIGYRVQVRCERTNHAQPLELADGMVTTTWRDVQFARSNNPAGIPERDFGNLRQHGFLTLLAARALAWTVTAQCEYKTGEVGMLECRLVAFKVESSWKITRIGVRDEKITTEARYDREELKGYTP